LPTGGNPKLEWVLALGIKSCFEDLEEVFREKRSRKVSGKDVGKVFQAK